MICDKMWLLSMKKNIEDSLICVCSRVFLYVHAYLHVPSGSVSVVFFSLTELEVNQLAILAPGICLPRDLPPNTGVTDTYYWTLMFYNCGGDLSSDSHAFVVATLPYERHCPDSGLFIVKYHRRNRIILNNGKSSLVSIQIFIPVQIGVCIYSLCYVYV